MMQDNSTGETDKNSNENLFGKDDLILLQGTACKILIHLKIGVSQNICIKF